MKETCNKKANSIYQLRETHLSFDGEWFWIIDNLNNCIFKSDSSLDKIEFVAFYPDKYVPNTNHAFGNVIRIEDKLYLIPITADDIYVYDLLNNSYKKMGLDYSFFKGLDTTRLNIVPYYYNGFLYCIIRNPDFVIKINVKDEVINLIDISKHKFADSEKLGISFKTDFKVDRIGSDLIIPYLVEDVVIVFNFETEKFYSKKLGIEKMNSDWLVGFSKVDDDNGVLFSKEGKIFTFGKETCEIKNGSEGLNDTQRDYFVNAIFLNNKLWIIKSNDYSIDCLDLTNGNNCKVNNLNLHINTHRECLTYAIKSKTDIICGSEIDGGFVIALNTNTMEEKVKNLIIPKELLREMPNNEIFEVDNLDEFIEYIS